MSFLKILPDASEKMNINSHTIGFKSKIKKVNI